MYIKKGRAETGSEEAENPARWCGLSTGNDPNKKNTKAKPMHSA